MKREKKREKALDQRDTIKKRTACYFFYFDERPGNSKENTISCKNANRLNLTGLENPFSLSKSTSNLFF